MKEDVDAAKEQVRFAQVDGDPEAADEAQWGLLNARARYNAQLRGKPFVPPPTVEHPALRRLQQQIRLAQQAYQLAERGEAKTQAQAVLQAAIVQYNAKYQEVRGPVAPVPGEAVGPARPVKGEIDFGRVTTLPDRTDRKPVTTTQAALDDRGKALLASILQEVTGGKAPTPEQRAAIKQLYQQRSQGGGAPAPQPQEGYDDER
jgi:hypothetical protein